MPIIKVKIEIEVFVKSNDDIDEGTSTAIEELYNTAYDWVNNDDPPLVQKEILDDIDLWGMYIDNEWHA